MHASGAGEGVRGTGDGQAAGVVGVGGIGVIGRSAAGEGRVSRGDPSETGVYGIGQDGVKGVGLDGRGGIFESLSLVSKGSAQVQLVPAEGRLVPPEGVFQEPAPTPMLVKPRPALPKTGRGGDLMTVAYEIKKGEGPDELILKQCALWLCVQGETDKKAPAMWAQVLLDSPFVGTE